MDRAAPILLDHELLPPPESALRNGLVAVGGKLTVSRLREAYAKGIFPWSAEPASWWSPDPRAVFPLDGLKIPRRLRQKIRQGRYRVTGDRAFADVIRACAEQPRDGESTWISEPFLEAYEELHRAGLAHSVEIWSEADELIGGVYGVASGACFSGESMFHRRSDASKLALFHLVERLQAGGFQLFDAQVLNPFTEQMGAVEIPREGFLARLREAVVSEAVF